MKSLILPPLGALYGVITRTHARLYEQGTFKPAKLDRPVISVGNITVGGTGKTPMVEWVSRTLAQSGKKVCILTRGYGRSKPNRRILVSDGKSVFSSPAEAGDEPYLLATNLAGIAAVISDADRFSAGRGAIKHLGSDCFVLDDGFQHFRLDRSLNIVMIDAADPWDGRQTLPAGRLREPLSGLKRADCFVLTRCDQVDSTESVRSDLSKLSGDRPIFSSRMVATGLKGLDGTAYQSLQAQEFLAFCGVGNPKSFFTHLRRNDYRVSVERAFGDHHNYTQSDVDALVKSAHQTGARAMITTQKDAVKLRDLQFSIPCYYLQIKIEIDNEAELQRIVLAAANT